MRFYKYDRTGSNDPINQKVIWDYEKIQLYNVQFKIDTHKSIKLINKFVYAYDRDDAINLVIKKYQNFKVNKDNIYCQRVDIIRGMMFSRNY